MGGLTGIILGFLLSLVSFLSNSLLSVSSSTILRLRVLSSVSISLSLLRILLSSSSAIIYSPLVGYLRVVSRIFRICL